MTYETETYLNFMGRDFVAMIEYTVSDWGAPALIDYNYGGDPGWGPEWDIEAITLHEDREGDLGPDFVVTGKLFQSLANNIKIYDAVNDSVNYKAQDRDYEEDYD
jgi:hypothetical protein